jgi:tetratricopeptide (TPR) repeat protein
MSPSTLPAYASARLGRSLRASLAPLLAAAATLGVPHAANAAAPSPDTVAAVQLNDAGSALYAAGDYAAALDSFERAYSLVAEPNLLFNIAGCRERLGQKSQALEYYRWFLGSSSTNSDGRRRAIAAIARLSATPPEAPREPPEPASGWDSPVWPIATLGAGLLFAGLGAGLYLDGAHDHNEVTNAPGFDDASGSGTLTQVEAQQLIDSGDTKKLIGGIAFGFGTALIATHLVITVWRSSEHDEASSSAELRLVPGGWSLAGSF